MHEALAFYQCWHIILIPHRSGQPGEFTRLLGCNAGELLHRPVSWPYPIWVTTGVRQIEGDV